MYKKKKQLLKDYISIRNILENYENYPNFFDEDFDKDSYLKLKERLENEEIVQKYIQRQLKK